MSSLVLWGVLPLVASVADAQVTLLSEDFEGLSLLDSDLASDGDNETDWTNVGPAGWSVDNRNTPVNPDRPEFQGWTYLDHAFWVDQQGNQVGRLAFLPQLQPNNTIAVADPDAHDDFASNSPNLFSSVIRSPSINLGGVAAGSVRVGFDSTWAPEDLQEGQFNVVVDGVRTNLFTWDSQPNANFKPLAVNERVEIPISNLAGASEMFFEWDIVEAGNDWWWGIDNVLIESTGQTQFLSLAVNSATGATSIENLTGDPIEINYYEIQSPSGSLVPEDFPVGWNSLDDQDFDAIGSGIGQSWDEGALSDQFELVEAFLLGSSTFQDGETVGLGNAFSPVDAQDLVFFYAGSEGILTQGFVRYVDSGVSGDFDGNSVYDCADVDALVAEIVAGTNDPTFDLTADGSVDGSDLTAWLAEAGAAQLPSGNSYLRGDANLDGFVDIPDFNVWNGNKFTATAAWCDGDFNADGFVEIPDFNIWNSNKFTSADVGAVIVPEPHALVLLLTCLGGLRWLRWNRRREF